MSPKEEPRSPRRKIFDEHLHGFTLGETEVDDVKEKLGAPAKALDEDRVSVLEYDSPSEQAIARWSKVQFIFFDDLLLNVSYSEPSAPLARAALQKVLGAPDESGDDEDEGEAEEEGLTDVFEVDIDDEPMLSFVAHYKKSDETVEALSLCADMSDDGDEIDDEDGEIDEDLEGEGDEADDNEEQTDGEAGHE